LKLQINSKFFNFNKEKIKLDKRMDEIHILLIVIGIVAVILLGYYALQADQTETITEEEITKIKKQIDKTTGDLSLTSREWLTSGPFQIDKSQYLLGENIFVRITNLAQNEKGQVAFLRPMNETHYAVYVTYPFDSEVKSSFNSYFTPDLSRALKICSKNDLIGDWRVVFQGTNYENLSFEIIDDYLPGETERFEEVVC